MPACGLSQSAVRNPSELAGSTDHGLVVPSYWRSPPKWTRRYLQVKEIISARTPHSLSGWLLRCRRIRRCLTVAIPRARGLPICIFRLDEDRGDLHDASVRVFYEDDPVGSDPLTESPLPLRSLQRLHVAPLGVVRLLKLINRSLNTIPHFTRAFRQLLLGFVGNLNAVAHVLRHARALSLHV